MKHVVGFSGGVDSQAVARWCLDRFPKEDVILTNSDAGGNEHPLTTAFIRRYSETVHPVVMVSATVADMGNRNPAAIEARGLKPTDPLTFDLMAELKGRFPSTKARFCTTHLKLYPMLRWCYENGAARIADPYYRDLPPRQGILSGGFERYAGVRRDESASRADVDEREWDDLFGCWLNRPLASWTKAQVFDYLASFGEEVNPLYTLGFGRVGCAPCVNSGKEDIRLWASRFPEMIDKIRAWETAVGRTFFPPILPTGVKAVRLPGEDAKAFKARARSVARRHGFIDEVVEWSRTVRGGIQYEMPLLEADVQSGMCMSKYGLCE